MTQTRTPVSFIASAQREAAKVFYRDVMGLDLREDGPYALAFRDGEALLRVQIVKAITPASHTVHGWQVTDIEAEIAALTAQGVQFLRFAQMDQDDLGVWTTPDGHKIAWFTDPCGNVLSFTQYVLAE